VSETFLDRHDTTPVTEEIVMAEAAILSLESYRQEALELKFRERLHRELDKWLDCLEDVMDDSEKPSGLWGITQGIRGQREELMGAVAKEWIEKEYASYLHQEHANCPICGRWLKRWTLAEKTEPIPTDIRDYDWPDNHPSTIFLLLCVSSWILPTG